MLRERYEQMREQALRVGIGTGSDILMRQGMRSWMEADWQGESAADVRPPAAGRLRPDQDFHKS